MSDILSTVLRIDKETPYVKRAKLDTGTECNHSCWFCYYKGDLDKKKPLEQIKRDVDYLVECNIQEVDLSGGESSIHDNWFEILDYCKSEGLRVSTLSNGYRFADRSFMYESQQHGLEEILFSLHGYDEISHNKAVGSPNAFKHIIQAIHNAHEFGIKVRINCVVSESNYRGLPMMYPDLIRELNPYEVNFLTLNFWQNAGDIKYFSYKKSTDSIKECIDSMDFVPIINVRYTPYCYMIGYEKYVCNIYQHIYDLYDWNMAVYNGHAVPEVYNNNPLLSLHNMAKTRRLQGYHKYDKCKTCKYYFLCDGIENGVEDDVYPVEGTGIKDVNHYRKGYYEDKCSDSDT